MDNTIAEITVDPKARRVIRVDHIRHEIRFKCQRCAVFCCKLGPPRLSKKDVERLELARGNVDTFLDEQHLNLRTNEDGSCVLLSPDSLDALPRCSLYDSRPTLCRLYPFQFQRLSKNLYALRLITCCTGLNTGNGVPIDMKFIIGLARSELFGLIDSGMV